MPVHFQLVHGKRIVKQSYPFREESAELPDCEAQCLETEHDALHVFEDGWLYHQSLRHHLVGGFQEQSSRFLVDVEEYPYGKDAILKFDHGDVVIQSEQDMALLEGGVVPILHHASEYASQVQRYSAVLVLWAFLFHLLFFYMQTLDIFSAVEAFFSPIFSNFDETLTTLK